MVQTLEREPTDEMNHVDGAHGDGMTSYPMAGEHESPATSRMPPYDVSRSKSYMVNGEHRLSLYRDNPHKYLLFKPSINQILLFLANGCRELHPNGALLLYMSADGCFSTTKHPEDCEFILPSIWGGSKFNINRFLL